ncbi:MAG: ATP-binding protein [Deltaproteobacteria bacterium]|nr:ATP-binding protein [Deltaproteobacteria bacterium]
MFTRHLPLPDHSFFLFGPRATGKTTWLRQVLPDAAWFDLVRNDVYLRLLNDPSRFRVEVEALEEPGWVVVDEVQRVPALLHEVHGLIEHTGKRHRFVLCGSSARKLRRLEADLLAGRVLNRSFFPLTLAELGGERPLGEILRLGLLPVVWDEPRHAVETLEAYASNYLREEIQQEALTRNLASFARFLRVAATLNGQAVNVANIARDSAVPRQTVQRYFDVLADTLVGTWLPAWQPRARVREVAHPKFFFFDCGAVRAAAGRVRAPLHDADRGPLLETLLLHELRAHINVSGCGGELSYYRTGAGVEVDFVWSGPDHAVGIEVKAGGAWRHEAGRGLRELLQQKVVARAVGVFTGERAVRDGEVTAYPVREFLRRLPELIR